MEVGAPGLAFRRLGNYAKTYPREFLNDTFQRREQGSRSVPNPTVILAVHRFSGIHDSTEFSVRGVVIIA